MDLLVTIICLVISVNYVNSMAINGTAITRYDPCGLGFIHFDKFEEKHWKSVVNFRLYPKLTSVELELEFENQVKIYAVSQNSTFIIKNDWHNFTLRRTDIPERFWFLLSMENLQPNQADAPVVNRVTLNNVTLCDQTVKASQTIESLNVTQNNRDKYEHVCGRRSLDHTELVSMRSESKAGDWPWHVAILIRNLVTNDTRYECGGNIIDRTTILTAGHCISRGGVALEPLKIVIIAGIDNHKDLTYQVGKQIRIAEKVVLHPNYDDAEPTADLAIIKISRLEYSAYVQPICVWGPVYDKTALYGKEAVVVGFGSTENNIPSDTLRATNTVVQNDTTCLNYDYKLYKNLLNEFSFCVGYGPTSGINPRNGDSGGGIVVSTMQPDNKLSWFLRGILSKCGVSQGQTACDPKFYVVYTDVGPHYGWIYHHSMLQFTNNIVE